jgi:acyl carrier protein
MDTAARLRAILVSCGPLRDDALALGPGARLRDDLGYDSLDLAELGCEVEKAFGVRLPGDARLNTVGDLFACVEQAKERAS